MNFESPEEEQRKALAKKRSIPSVADWTAEEQETFTRYWRGMNPDGTLEGEIFGNDTETRPDHTLDGKALAKANRKRIAMEVLFQCKSALDNVYTELSYMCAAGLTLYLAVSLLKLPLTLTHCLTAYLALSILCERYDNPVKQQKHLLTQACLILILYGFTKL